MGAVSVQAAPIDFDPIVWQSSVNMYQGSTVETFVNTTGDLKVGYNNTPDTVDGNVTVNGVAFTQTLTGNTLVGGGGESITINGGTDNGSAFGDGEFSSNGNIYHLLQGGTYDVSSVTLGGLQIGQEYLIQSFNNDARGNRHLNFVTGYSDGNFAGVAGMSQLNNSPVNGDAPVFPETNAGDSIIGTFTAGSANLTFSIYGTTGGTGGSFSSGNSQSQINAIQLRAIPEPATLGLVVTFSGAVLFIRRRFMM